MRRSINYRFTTFVENWTQSFWLDCGLAFGLFFGKGKDLKCRQRSIQGRGLFGRLKDLASFQNGNAAVEFALVAVPFLAMLIGLIQLFIFFQAQAVLETAAESAGRQILTGSVQKQGLSQSQFQTLVCGYIPAFLSCSGVMVDVEVASSFAAVSTSTPTLTYNSQGQVTNTWQFSPGVQGSIVILRVLYQLPIVGALGFNISNLANGSRLLMATSVFKNESY